MKSFLSHPYFQFTRSQRAGIFIFLLVVIVFQLIYCFSNLGKENQLASEAQVQWVAHRLAKDTFGGKTTVRKSNLRPFNPNFITDFKGYQLGMTVEQLDRLFAFRKADRFVNSAIEFQEVTKVSDAQLKKLAPYFKFPEWVTKKSFAQSGGVFPKKKEIITPQDLNAATAEDLKKVYGIGDALSERILKERTRWGAFVSMDQLNDVYGLSPEVVSRLQERFAIVSSPKIQKINVNTATIKELMQFPYFRYPLARSIVAYRSMNGPFRSAEDLTKISGFPVDRMNIIALYLEF